MRIIYTGILWAAAVRPISGSGFWAAFPAAFLLIPIVLSIRKMIVYFRLINSGDKTLAEICHTDPVGWGSSRHYRKYYSYYVKGDHFGDVFYTGYRYKKYADKKKITVYYDPGHPKKHVIQGISLYEPLSALILCGLPFAAFLYLFIYELLKCF